MSEGDELVGLTRAFLHAGAPSLIASLWPVDAAATRQLMVSFYARLRKTFRQTGVIDTADALRHATLDAMTVSGEPSTFLWAPFVLVGDWLRE